MHRNHYSGRWHGSKLADHCQMSNPHPSNLSLVVLAGGASRRMGEDKAFVLIQGKPLIQHILGGLSPLNADETLVITHNPKTYIDFKVTAHTDIIPNKGPLSGLHSALTYARHDYIALVGCDMPRASGSLFISLTKLLKGSQAHSAVPRWQGKAEPLHAVYHRKTLPFVEQQLQTNDWSMMTLLQSLDTIYHNVIDSSPFMNINTPVELEQSVGLFINPEVS